MLLRVDLNEIILKHISMWRLDTNQLSENWIQYLEYISDIVSYDKAVGIIGIPRSPPDTNSSNITSLSTGLALS